MCIDNKIVSEPSSSKSNPSLSVRPKVTHNPTSNVKPKLSRIYWAPSIKAKIKDELGDCIHNIANLTRERANAFMERYGLQDRGFSRLKNVVYNMGRNPR